MDFASVEKCAGKQGMESSVRIWKGREARNGRQATKTTYTHHMTLTSCVTLFTSSRPIPVPDPRTPLTSLSSAPIPSRSFAPIRQSSPHDQLLIHVLGSHVCMLPRGHVVIRSSCSSGVAGQEPQAGSRILPRRTSACLTHLTSRRSSSSPSACCGCCCCRTANVICRIARRECSRTFPSFRTHKYHFANATPAVTTWSPYLANSDAD